MQLSEVAKMRMSPLFVLVLEYDSNVKKRRHLCQGFVLCRVEVWSNEGNDFLGVNWTRASVVEGSVGRR